MPRTIDEPVLALRSDDISRVDGIELEVAVIVICLTYPEVQALVRSIGDDKALVFPLIGCRIRSLHQSDECTLAPCTITIDSTWAGDAIIHTIEIVIHLAYTWCPISEVQIVGKIGIITLWHAHLLANLIELRLDP